MRSLTASKWHKSLRNKKMVWIFLLLVFIYEQRSSLVQGQVCHLDFSSAALTTVSETELNKATITCDRNFYNRFNTNQKACNGEALDVDRVLRNVAGCNIFNGQFRANSVPEPSQVNCITFCRLPACDASGWDYTQLSGLNSTLYKGFDLSSLLSSKEKEDLLLTNKQAFATMTMFSFIGDQMARCESTSNSAASYRDCGCPLTGELISTTIGNGNNSVVEEKEEKETKITESVGAAAGAAGTASSIGVAGYGLSTITIDVFQNILMLGQLNLALPSSLQKFCDIFSFSMGVLPIKALNKKVSREEPDKKESRRRRLEVNEKKLGTINTKRGIAGYSNRKGVEYDRLLYLTLASFAFMIGFLCFIYLFALLIVACLRKHVRKYARDWSYILVKALMLLGIVSQYAIGVSATFSIYVCVLEGKYLTLLFFVAVSSLLILALGVIVFGILIVYKHDERIQEVGTLDHLRNSVNKRYGIFYDEYKYESRYFFAPKMLVALMSGIIVGCVGLPGLTQLILLIVIHTLFLSYLGYSQPYQTNFLLSAAISVTVIQLVVFVLAIFLSSSEMIVKTSSDTQNIIAYCIITLQCAVLLCLVFRQIYVLFVRRKQKQQMKAIDSEQMYKDEVYSPMKGKESYRFETSVVLLEADENLSSISSDYCDTVQGSEYSSNYSSYCGTDITEARTPTQSSRDTSSTSVTYV